MSQQDSNEKFQRENVEHRRYAPRWVREQPEPAPEQPYIDSAPVSPAASHPHRAEWPPISDFNSAPHRIPEPSVRLEEESTGLIGRIAIFVTFAACIALLIIFAKPLSQLAGGLFDNYSERADAKADRAPLRNAATDQPAPAPRASVPAGGIALASAGILRLLPNNSPNRMSARSRSSPQCSNRRHFPIQRNPSCSNRALLIFVG
jgi:hypothetical protein